MDIKQMERYLLSTCVNNKMLLYIYPQLAILEFD